MKEPVAGSAAEEAGVSVRFVQEHYDAYNRGDLDAIAEGLHPDVVFRPGDPRATLELGGPFRGREEVFAWFRQLREALTQNRVEVVHVETHDSGRVVASVYMHGTFKDTGASGALPSVHVFTVRDGLIVENVFYRESDRRPRL